MPEGREHPKKGWTAAQHDNKVPLENYFLSCGQQPAAVFVNRRQHNWAAASQESKEIIDVEQGAAEKGSAQEEQTGL